MTVGYKRRTPAGRPLQSAVVFVGAVIAAVGLATARPAAAQCQPVRGHTAGLGDHAVEVGGQARRFRVYVPRSYRGDTPVPVVLDLHASGITPEVELRVTRFDAAAERHGFLVVLPQGVTPFPRGGRTWNVPPRAGGVDDVAFVQAVLDAVARRFCVDAARVYASGFSGGGRLASRLPCGLPGRFAAIAVVGGLRAPDDGGCADGAPAVPVIAMHSRDDPVNPYEHDGAASPPYWRYGVDRALRGWIAHNGCRAPAEATRVAAGVERQVYAGCADGAVVAFYRLSGSGHTWPGSGFTFPAYLGPTEHAVDATRVIAAFFRRFRRPGG